jgi:hypothetical protein
VPFHFVHQVVVVVAVLAELQDLGLLSAQHPHPIESNPASKFYEECHVLYDFSKVARLHLRVNIARNAS